MSKITWVKLNKAYIGDLMKSQKMMDCLIEQANLHGSEETHYVTSSRCVVGVNDPDEELLSVAHKKRR